MLLGTATSSIIRSDPLKDSGADLPALAAVAPADVGGGPANGPSRRLNLPCAPSWVPRIARISAAPPNAALSAAKPARARMLFVLPS